MRKNKIILSSLALVALIGIMGLVVWRVRQAQTTIDRPKATDCSECANALPGTEACNSDCKGCPACGTSSDGGGAHNDGSITVCKYMAGTENFACSSCTGDMGAEEAAACEKNKIVKDRKVKLQTLLNNNDIGEITDQPAKFSWLSYWDNHKVTVNNEGLAYTVQAIVCDQGVWMNSDAGYVCFRDGAAFCRSTPYGECTSETPATAVAGTEVTLNIPDQSKHAEVYYRFGDDGNNLFNTCWTSQPIPKNPSPGSGGTNISLTPTFTWAWNTTWSSTLNQAVIYLSDDANISHVLGTVTVNSLGSTSINLSQFGLTTLQPNKQYWWKVNANSYSSPDTSHECMPIWTFTTGAGSGCQTGTVACSSGCANLQTDANNCGSCGNVCASGSCVASSCTAVATHLECQNNTCVSVSGSGSNTCSTVGATCGSTTKTGQCLVPSATHLECVNSSCVRKIGSGSNTGGCTSVGTSCSTTTTCNSTNCASGCCSGNTCKAYSDQTTSACGTGGSACASCSTGVCSSGVCTTSCSSTVGAATISSPTSAATSVSTTPTFSWTPYQDMCTSGATYIVYYGTSSSPSTVMTNCSSISSTSCTAGTTLVSGTTYYWKVRTYLNGSYSDSSVYSFTTTGDQESACWGNGGVNGKCYDCNGDGVINILDFQCFRVRYGTAISS